MLLLRRRLRRLPQHGRGAGDKICGGDGARENRNEITRRLLVAPNTADRHMRNATTVVILFIVLYFLCSLSSLFIYYFLALADRDKTTWRVTPAGGRGRGRDSVFVNINTLARRSETLSQRLALTHHAAAAAADGVRSAAQRSSGPVNSAGRNLPRV